VVLALLACLLFNFRLRPRRFPPIEEGEEEEKKKEAEGGGGGGGGLYLTGHLRCQAEEGLRLQLQLGLVERSLVPAPL
jgi:hypothetical protein